MRSLFRLIMSLVVSAGFLMGLSAAGVVRFNPDAPLEPAAMGAKVQAGVSAAMERMQTAEYLSEAGADRSGPPSSPADDSDPRAPDRTDAPESSIPEDARLPVDAPPPVDANEPARDPAMEAALTVLAAWADKPAGSNPEPVLRQQLRALGIAPERIDQIVMMSFWKGFVTLQGGAPAGATDGGGEAMGEALSYALEQELALKQAGFAALGLRSGEDLAAQARRLLLVQQVSTQGGER